MSCDNDEVGVGNDAEIEEVEGAEVAEMTEETHNDLARDAQDDTVDDDEAADDDDEVTGFCVDEIGFTVPLFPIISSIRSK